MSAFLSSHTHTHGDSMSLAHVGLALRLSALYFSQEFESTKRHFPPHSSLGLIHSVWWCPSLQLGHLEVFAPAF